MERAKSSNICLNLSRLNLAERLHYKPDFFAIYSDPKRGCAFFEVKASAFHAGGQSNQMNSYFKAQSRRE
jgi:hypothetical protein